MAGADKLNSNLTQTVIPEAQPVVRDPLLPAVPGMTTAEMGQYAAQRPSAAGEPEQPKQELPVLPTGEEYRAAKDAEIQRGVASAQAELKAAPLDAKVKLEDGKAVVTPPRSFVPEYDQWTAERSAEKALENAGYGTFKAREMSALLTEYNRTGELSRDVIDVLGKLEAASRPKERVFPEGYKDSGKPMGIFEKPTVWQRDALAVAGSLGKAINGQVREIADELKAGLAGQRFADAASLNAAAEAINPNALFVLSELDKDREASMAKTGKSATGWYSELIDPLKADQKKMAESAPMVFGAIVGMGGTPEFATQVVSGKGGAKGEALFRSIMNDYDVNISKGKPSDLPTISVSGAANYAWDDTKKATGTIESGADVNLSNIPDEKLLSRGREVLAESKDGTLQDRAISAVQKSAEELGVKLSAEQATARAKTLFDENKETETVFERTAAFTAQQKSVANLADVTTAGASLRTKEDTLTKQLYKQADKDGGGTSFEEYAAEYVNTFSRADEPFVKDIVRAIKDPASVHPDVTKLAQALVNQWQDAGGKIAKDQITAKMESGQSKADTANQYAASERVTFPNGTKAPAAPNTAIPSEDGKTVYMSAAPFSDQTLTVVKTADVYTTQLIRATAERSASAAASVRLSDSDFIPLKIDITGSVERLVSGWQTKTLSPDTIAAVESAGFSKEDSLKAIRYAHEAAPASVQVFLDGLAAIKGSGLIGTEKSGLTKLIQLSSDDVAKPKLAIEDAARAFAYAKTSVSEVVKDGSIKTTSQSQDPLVYLSKIEDVPALKGLSTDEGRRSYNAVLNDKQLGGPLMEQLFASGTKDGFERGTALLLHGLRAVHETAAVNAVAGLAGTVVGRPLSKPYSPGQIAQDRGLLESKTMNSNLTRISEYVYEQAREMNFDDRADINTKHGKVRSELGEIKKALSASVRALTNNGLPVSPSLKQAQLSIEENIGVINNAAAVSASADQQTTAEIMDNAARRAAYEREGMSPRAAYRQALLDQIDRDTGGPAGRAKTANLGGEKA